MSKIIAVLKDTAKIQSQWPAIAESRRNAIKGCIEKSYPKVTGLTESDPPELWLYAFAKSESRADPVTGSALIHQKELGDHIRQYNPTYDADQAYEAGQQWMAQHGNPTLHETIMRLTTRIKDPADLREHIEKLFKLDCLPRITRTDYHHEDKLSDDKTAFLVKHWIQEPPRKDWALASLCVYSARALAKLTYFFTSKIDPREQLPPDEVDSEIERIEKICERLKLVPAKPRLIRDVVFRKGEPQPKFFASALRKL